MLNNSFSINILQNITFSAPLPPTIANEIYNSVILRNRNTTSNKFDRAVTIFSDVLVSVDINGTSIIKDDINNFIAKINIW